MENSIIGRLPPELRNKIYDLIIPDPGEIRLNVCRRGKQTAINTEQKDYWALARTCKSIWRESMSLLFGQSSVTITFTPFYLSSCGSIFSPGNTRPMGFFELQQWLSIVGPETLRCARNLELVMNSKLEFVAKSSVAEMQPVTAWLGQNLSAIRALLGDTTEAKVTLSLPGNHYTGCVAMTGYFQDCAYFHARIDSFTEGRKARVKALDLKHPLMFRMSPQQMAEAMVQEDQVTERIKWFLTEILT